jgi:WD40 repeat protein
MSLANGVNPDEVICGFYDGEIRIFNYDTEKVLSRLIGHQAIINNLEVLSKQILISSSTDFQIRIWCLYTNKCLKTILETKRTNAIEKIDENSFATGSEDNSIKKVLFLLPFIINHNLK